MLQNMSRSTKRKTERGTNGILVRNENWTDELQLNQLRCLWTAYCFHQNMEVDTFGYDTELKQLWREIDGAEEIFVSYECFYNYMAEYLV